MNQMPSSEIKQLKLNGQPAVHPFTAEVKNLILINGKAEHSHIAISFSMQLVRVNSKGNLEYRIKVAKRLFLDKKGHSVLKPSKAQKLALSIATINDNLMLELEEKSKLISVLNTEDIRKKWKSIKPLILNSFPDILGKLTNFDSQLKEENIQDIFLTDNFYQFFLSNIFYQEIENNKLPETKKTLSNGFGNLDIPIIEKRNIIKQDMLFQNVTIGISGDLDTLTEAFPLDKMNKTLGGLIGESGSNHDLEFTYNGSYQVKPRIGLVTRGKLEYEFKVPGIYQKNTIINFNLESDE